MVKKKLDVLRYRDVTKFKGTRRYEVVVQDEDGTEHTLYVGARSFDPEREMQVNASLLGAKKKRDAQRAAQRGGVDEERRQAYQRANTTYFCIDRIVAEEREKSYKILLQVENTRRDTVSDWSATLGKGAIRMIDGKKFAPLWLMNKKVEEAKEYFSNRSKSGWDEQNISVVLDVEQRIVDEE